MDYKRPDGRLPNEIRDIIISFDGLDGVDGSARFGFGDTKALASVSGPIEVRLAAEQANRATFEVTVRPLSGLPGTDSKALASSLRNALLPSMILTNNPRTLVQLVALSLTPVPAASSSPTYPSEHEPTQNPSPNPDPNRSGRDGQRRGRGRGRGYGRIGRTQTRSNVLRTSPALVSSLINASSLALLNASSIPLRGVICAISIGRVHPQPSTSTSHTSTNTNTNPPNDSTLLIDPSSAELSNLTGTGTFAFLVTVTRDKPHPLSHNPHDSQETPTGEETKHKHKHKHEHEHDQHKQDHKRLKAELVWSHVDAVPVPFEEDELMCAMELARAGALRVWEGMRDAVERALFGLGTGPENARVEVNKEVVKTTLDAGVDDADSDAKMEIS